MDKSHNEFLKDVAHASALPAQTCRALGPESEEDMAMYLQEHDNLTGNANRELDEIINDSVKGIKTPTKEEEAAVLDAVYTEGVKDESK